MAIYTCTTQTHVTIMHARTHVQTCSYAHVRTHACQTRTTKRTKTHKDTHKAAHKRHIYTHKTDKHNNTHPDKHNADRHTQRSSDTQKKHTKDIHTKKNDSFINEKCPITSHKSENTKASLIF